ncbi:MAG: M14 family zinc carboxypeptidase [Pseudomonadota bacterium]
MRLLLVLLLLPLSALADERPSAYWPDADYDPAIPTVNDVLGYRIGDRIVPPADILRYFEALKSAAPGRVTITEYARSWQDRPLYYVAISSADNIANLETIKTNMQRLANPAGTTPAEAEAIIANQPAVTWLSYAVHGNEISPSDSAIVTAYHLLASRADERVGRIMADTVVVIDPLQNPDGRARFIHNYENERGLQPDADRLSAEHNERWPGGRMNHYLFDLNRDWFKLTQPETQGRVREIQKFFPVAFVDSHEMGSDTTYYFSPEAIPYNPHLAADQRASLELFGRTNAGWFDRFGIDYFTREIFDALYPGYGASWPSYFGSVAMTYEQGSARGLVVRQYDGELLHFSETIRNNVITSLATAETVQVNRRKLLEDFYDYRVSAIEEGRSEDIRSYLVPAQADQDGADKLAGLMTLHGVEVRRATESFRACRQSYPAGSYIIDLAQPAKRLIRTLLDQDVPINPEFMAEQERRRAKDLFAEIYDVTAWSLPLMMNIDVDACSQAVSASSEAVGERLVTPGSLAGDRDAIVYLVPWGEASAVRLTVAALQDGIAIKSTDKAFTHMGTRYPAGTVIIDAADNRDDLGEWLAVAAVEAGAEVVGVSDSWVTDGPNFGSNNVVRLPSLKVAMAWDQPTSPYSAGATRFIVEQQFGLPVTPIRLQQLRSANLQRYHVLLLPETSSGGYASALGESGIANLSEWVREGGVVIGLGNATRFLADAEIDWLSVRREEAAIVADDDEDKKPTPAAEEEDGKSTVAGSVIDSAEAFEAAIAPTEASPDRVPGVLARATPDPDHWLAAGVAPELHVLVRGSDIYTPAKLGDGTNVVRFRDADSLLASGYLWEENLAQLAYKPFVVHAGMGRGEVIAFTQDPTVRAYLDGLNVILMNAILRGAAHARPVR